jgi:hypothetical protein
MSIDTESIPNQLARLQMIFGHPKLRELIKTEDAKGNLQLTASEFEICGGKRKREDQPYSTYRQFVLSARFLREKLSKPTAVKMSDVRSAGQEIERFKPEWADSDDEDVNDLDGDVEEEEADEAEEEEEADEAEEEEEADEAEEEEEGKCEEEKEEELEEDEADDPEYEGEEEEGGEEDDDDDDESDDDESDEEYKGDGDEEEEEDESEGEELLNGALKAGGLSEERPKVVASGIQDGDGGEPGEEEDGDGGEPGETNE